jgi:hypothetical protein
MRACYTGLRSSFEQRMAYLGHGLGLALWLLGCGARAPAPAMEPSAADKADLIRVRAPHAGAVVLSPLRVVGEARGTWFFEATFPVALLDAQGRTLVQSYAQAQGEWMTEAFVPFTAELRFAPVGTAAGTLVLEKSNPSGLPEHADALRIAVRFAEDAAR